VNKSVSRRPEHRRPVTRSSPSNDPEVYPPREDSFLLLPFARARRGQRFAEVGAGRGLASLQAAEHGAQVVATDVNPAALRQLRSLAQARALSVEVVRTDLLRGLRRFDRIVANPPYLPTTPEERDPDPGTNLALDGGPDGCRVTARLLDDLPDHLTPGASAYVVSSSEQDPSALSAIFDRWSDRGGRRAVVAERRLEGEVLQVQRLWRPDGSTDRTRRAARRTTAPRPGTGGRRRSPRPSPPGSSRGAGRGRTIVRGGASGRRRSPPGS
jgi:release factor glutamine methyltransferase